MQSVNRSYLNGDEYGAARIGLQDLTSFSLREQDTAKADAIEHAGWYRGTSHSYPGTTLDIGPRITLVIAGNLGKIIFPQKVSVHGTLVISPGTSVIFNEGLTCGVLQGIGNADLVMVKGDLDCRSIMLYGDLLQAGGEINVDGPASIKNMRAGGDVNVAGPLSAVQNIEALKGSLLASYLQARSVRAGGAVHVSTDIVVAHLIECGRTLQAGGDIRIEGPNTASTAIQCGTLNSGGDIRARGGITAGEVLAGGIVQGTTLMLDSVRAEAIIGYRLLTQEDATVQQGIKLESDGTIGGTLSLGMDGNPETAVITAGTGITYRELVIGADSAGLTPEDRLWVDPTAQNLKSRRPR